MTAITFENLWEKYRIKFVVSGKVSWEEIWALQDISLTVAKGEVVGIIGQNGAGKTTLLRLIAGMLISDKGKIHVEGRVSALMELGAGFNMEFTGRENIVLNARAYGLSEDSIDKKIEEIVAFSGLGRFADAPIKYYSQGMYMRLAFALAIFSSPDILLIDDILAVGDEEAQQKCVRKVYELKGAGKTIVVVSHDMHMLSKLCDKVILLEKGKKIAEGSPETVIPYYTETAGSKKGVHVLEKENMRIVFNNGRLFLNYGQTIISGQSGSYVVISPQQEHGKFPSVNLAWEVEASGKDFFTVSGKYGVDLGAQIWNIALEGQELKFCVETGERDLKEVYMDMAFISDFTKCITFEQESTFPNFAHRTNWQEIAGQGAGSSVLGLIPSENRPDLPFLLIKAGNKGCSLKVFNSGYELESRIIQIRFSPLHAGLISLWMFKTKDEFNCEFQKLKTCYETRCKEEEGQGKVEDKKEEQQDISQNSISSGDMRLFVDLKDKAVRFYYKGREVSGPQGGIHNPFLLKYSKMKVRKMAQDHMSLILNYNTSDDDPLGLPQVWDFSFSGKNTIEVVMTIENLKEILLKECYFKLELRDVYQNWKTEYEQDDFQFEDPRKTFSPVRMKINKVSKVVLGTNRETYLFSQPGASFSNLACEAYQISEQPNVSIFKTMDPEGGPCVFIQFSKIIPRGKNLLPPGKHILFHSKISFDDKKGFDSNAAVDCSQEIRKDDSRVIFMNGKCAVFSGEKELTSGLGVFTSLRSSNVWFDSCQATWELIEKSEAKIAVLGHWPHIPVSQFWEISFKNKKTVTWRVIMEVHEKCNLELEQSNLMLSSEYKSWAAADLSRGMFTDEYTKEYDILPFRFWSGKNSTIETSGETLPRVKFSHSSQGLAPVGIIENTDTLYCARLLQFQREQSGPVLPGKYIYFNGEIEIET